MFSALSLSLLRSLAILGLFVGISSFHSVPIIQVELAFNLIPQWPNSGCTFAIIDHIEEKIYRIREIDERTFVLIATGHQRSKANPRQANLFEEFGVEGCEVVYNQPFREYEISCSPTQQPWKLRYQARPSVEGPGEAGWAGKELCPNDRQMYLLKGYGIQDLDDYVIGTKAFELLRNCSDPSWISHYK